MITSSYSDLEKYTASVYEDLEPKITPSTATSMEPPAPAVDILDPSSSINLSTLYPDLYDYNSDHTDPIDNPKYFPEQGWTEKEYMDDPNAGGFPRTAILSGSNGELKKLLVDEDITGSRLHISQYGYVDTLEACTSIVNCSLNVNGPTYHHADVELQDSASLEVSGHTKLNDLEVETTASIQHLIVNEDAEVAGNTVLNTLTASKATIEELHTNQSHVEGDLQVEGNVRVTQSLFVSGNTYISGDTVVTSSLTVRGKTLIKSESEFNDTAYFKSDVVVSGSLFVSGTLDYMNTEELYVKDKVIVIASGSPNATVADGAGINIDGANVTFHYNSTTDRMELNKGLDVLGDENITGSLYVSESTHISGNLTVTGSTNLQNVQATDITASNISASNSASVGDLYINNDLTVNHTTYINGNGADPSLVIQTGSIEAGNSDLTINNITASNILSEEATINNFNATNITASIISGTFYGDASHLTGITASVVSCSTETASYICTEPNNTYLFTHSLDTVNLLVEIFEHDPTDDNIPCQIIPEKLQVIDENHIGIVFGRTGSGYIVIAKAGHVIEQSEIEWERFLGEYNVHYGTTGSWQATSFTANTTSADTGSFGEIDTAKIGNVDRGSQYYEDRGWGSYLEFTDQGINAFVRNTDTTEEDINQVASIDRDGNLKIAGNLTTEAVFSTSDISKKENVVTLSDALDNIKKLRGVRFNWKDSGEASIGVIAQEIEAIYPELTKVVNNLDNSKQMVVNYDGLVGVLIEAVKSLSKKVEYLENKLNNENR